LEGISNFAFNGGKIEGLIVGFCRGDYIAPEIISAADNIESIVYQQCCKASIIAESSVQR